MMNMEIITLGRSVELIIGMLLGGLLCWLGYKLFEIGVSGKASLSAEHGKLKFQLVNASPGIFFALFGSFLIFSGISQTTKYYAKQLEGGRTFEVGLEKGQQEMLATAKDTLMHVNQGLYAQGLKQFKAGNSDEASNIFRTIVEGSTHYAESCNALSWVYLEKNREPARAIQLAKVAVALKPERVDFWHTLGRAYRLAGNIQEAKEALQRAINMDPSDGTLREELEKLAK
jgi:tetratricopeptide (TPR) repeat protein